ncbi:hypothetical protein HDU67_009605 [Dinochytrium kinnereticum]|nr:hypothetical protein HDU67_009605 [Dinochytrium kinnereticum]
MVGAAAVLVPIVKVVLEEKGVVKNVEMERVLKGRMASKIEGDFVVFHLGSRVNASFFTDATPAMGEALGKMRRELENSGPEVGYLGGEDYVGNMKDGSMTLSVQYWRSVKHLHDYAQDRSKEHYSPWKMMMESCRKDPRNGIWHETFLVKDGQYEGIYVNMPATGLGNCRDVEIVPASRGMSSMYKRLKMEKQEGSEMPSEFRKEY